ncbi:MAG: LacI family DNA-binding transcriptional regulator [Brevundimonas sp.]|uniref:LacI family DNA-binding transcriptional regulator n=1 Tax=Brevundimonas sp. TaxID=1871086 RepID=UPI001832BC2C|nr:LacI family DNA-binding transcriptional regulator [Brevundimonas sp.]MBA4803602.1 LacI family DNA-binding transcriptional regulator [Brevundimonas sp.]
MAGATIYDVAARAGVSIKSVSRVLNGEANVSEALRKKVEGAVAELGYRRSLSARSLAGSASSIIAALVDAKLTIEHWRSGRGNDYLSRLELGLLMECRQADHHLMVELVDYDAPTLRQDLSNLLAAVRPQGVVLTPPNSDNALVLDVLDETGTPYARIGPETALHRGVRIRMDDAGAAEEITRHLLDLGHVDLAYISGPPAYAASRLRGAGFRTALRKRGLTPRPEWMVEGQFTFRSGLEAAERLLAGPHRPTAIFAANDDMALGVLQAAAAAGLGVPRDLSVAGFDDTPSALFSTPALTTIRHPVAEMAAAAAQRLIPLLRARLESEGDLEDTTVPHSLVVRGSTARYVPPVA